MLGASPSPEGEKRKGGREVGMLPGQGGRAEGLPLLFASPEPVLPLWVEGVVERRPQEKKSPGPALALSIPDLIPGIKIK